MGCDLRKKENDTMMTNRQALEYAVANIDNADVIAKLEAMITALDKKAANRKPTKAQEENVKFKEMIVNFLTDNAGQGFTVTEIQNAIPDLNPAKVTNQRAGAIIRGLVDAEIVTRTVEKRKAYFAIA